MPSKPFISESSILDALDHCDKDGESNFPTLEHAYIYTADCRLNLFRDEEGHWAIVSEILGYNPRAMDYGVQLEIRYFGNCLHVPEGEDAKDNYFNIYPVDPDSFAETVDTEELLPDASCWIVRGIEVPLSFNFEEYVVEGFTDVGAQDVLRFLVSRNRPIFRATDEELYHWLPATLKKILVLDEWHHKSFHQQSSPFENPQFLTRFNLENPQVAGMVRAQLEQNRYWNAIEWEKRPSTYETWQQIARVLATGDTTLYNPTLPSNTHWKNWPEGGAL